MENRLLQNTNFSHASNFREFRE